MSTANSAVPEPRLHERSTYDVIENLRAMARARSARVILSLVVALVIVDFANSLSVPLPEYESFLSKLESERPSASLQEEATRAVLARLLPLHLDSFDFRIISKDECGGKSCFFISNAPSRSGSRHPEIRIAGTTGVELCAGLHWYLKYWCGAHISWDKTGGHQLQTVPTAGSLPRLASGGVRIQRAVDWNYYQNVVTSSYSFVWWDWERWEKEIDWMALQGVNLPLAFTGQEAIWQKVFKSADFNLTDSDLSNWFGGPAFLAWARMGNLHGWGGPLPRTWLDQQLKLQKTILSRMRSLGMTPVLPAFSGNVPQSLVRLFPSAKITQLGNWNTVDGDPRWCCTSLLEPTDPLFVFIGKAFVEQQIKEYGGTQHIYNCDTFNENEPPTDDPPYITSLGAAVYEAMSAGDKDAIWLMQGWLFSSDAVFWKAPQVQALVHSVPVGKMIILDLFADVKPVWLRSESFYGVPYIWCMLHNYGGNIEMYGRLEAVGTGPVEAATSSNSTMVGVGMCMEGIEQNPVVYDLMAEMAFRDTPVQTKDWISSYNIRRYGQALPGAQTAWILLQGSIYNCSDGLADHNGDVVVELPDVSPSVARGALAISYKLIQKQRSGTGGSTSQLLGHVPHLWYSPTDAIMALRFLLDSANSLGSVSTYRYDLVDLTRQVLSKLANSVYFQVIAAYQSGEGFQVEKLSDLFLELMCDMETLLATEQGFLLGPWLEAAKRLGTNEEEEELYEWNARTQLTMWFDNTSEEPSSLHDYANKMWSGLMRGYYLPRAALYMRLLKVSLEEDMPFPFLEWRRRWISLTTEWQMGREVYTTIPEGDAVEVASRLYSKYKDIVTRQRGGDPFSRAADLTSYM